MEDLTNQIVGKWKGLKFSHTVNGKEYRKRHLWLWECLNCKCQRLHDKHNLKDGSNCQNCFGKPAGEAGLNELLDVYERSTKRTNREFLLTKDDFKTLTSSSCHYCNSLPLKVKLGGKKTAKTVWGNYRYNGLDRVDNNKGYTLENCVSCCYICNRAKNSMTYTEFVAYINRIKGKNMNETLGKNFINGVWTARNDFTTVNPSNNKELFKFPATTLTEIETTIKHAKLAFNKWKEVSRVKRAEYFDVLAQLIKEHQDKLVKIISLETGKSINESYAEVQETLHMIQSVVGTGRQACGSLFSSEISEKECYVTRKPKGVIAVISPHNFPLAIGSAWCSAPAIVEGNVVIHKPSEITPMTAQIFAELYEKAGFPPGVYNLINGAEGTGRNLVESDVDCILFTGSSTAGRYIRQHCARTWKKTCSCEMGGKSAVIVFNDASISLAVDACLASSFKLSGQRCTTSGRLLIQKGIFEKFSEAFVEAAKKIKVRDPFEHGPDCSVDFFLKNESGFNFGPLISKEQIGRVEYFNKLVRDDLNAKVLYDPDENGRILSEGNFLRPFIYETKWRDVEYLKEEVFGPHVGLIPFDTVEEAIEIYNDTEYGLSLGVVTEDFKIMKQVRDNCKCGMMYLNGGSVAAESHLPFGGFGKSGYGNKSAAGTYKAVTDEVVTTINYSNTLTFPQGLK